MAVRERSVRRGYAAVDADQMRTDDELRAMLAQTQEANRFKPGDTVPQRWRCPLDLISGWMNTTDAEAVAWLQNNPNAMDLGGGWWELTR